MLEEQLPTPLRLAEDPELAVLAVLGFTLDATESALLAIYPELCGEPWPPSLPDTARLADRLLSLAGKLQGVIAHYRTALILDHAPALEKPGHDF